MIDAFSKYIDASQINDGLCARVRHGNVRARSEGEISDFAPGDPDFPLPTAARPRFSLFPAGEPKIFFKIFPSARAGGSKCSIARTRT